MGQREPFTAVSLGDTPRANATSPTDVDRFPWADPGDFDYSVCSRVLQTIPGTLSKRAEFGYAVQATGQSGEDAARGRAGGEWIALLCSEVTPKSWTLLHPRSS